MSWWAMWLASMTGLLTPPPVRLEVVAVDEASQADVTELRAWLQSALEKEGLSFTSHAHDGVDGPASRAFVVELGKEQWRIWATGTEAITIEASDFAVASLETLHQASLLLRPDASPSTVHTLEIAEFAEGAPVESPGEVSSDAHDAPRAGTSSPSAGLPRDVGLRPHRNSTSFASGVWLDLNVGSRISQRSNFVVGVCGAMFRTPNWGAVAHLDVHHVSDFAALNGTWNLGIWDYRLSAGPMFSLPLSERLRFNTAVEIGVTLHTFNFTNEGWGTRVNAQGSVPLEFSYQGPTWRFGLSANVTFNTATFTHRVFGAPVWETERWSSALLASLGKRIW